MACRKAHRIKRCGPEPAHAAACRVSQCVRGTPHACRAERFRQDHVEILTSIWNPVRFLRTIGRETAFGIVMTLVRPERRRDVLTGGSPVRVGAGAPGSRLPWGGEIRPYEAECQKPLKEREANQRAATNSERNSLVKLSAERCLGGPSRSCRGEGNRQHSARPEWNAGPSRGPRRWHVGKEQSGTGETLPGSRVGQIPGV
jgi:hypothetical protein